MITASNGTYCERKMNMMSKEGFFFQILRLFMETETEENKVGDLGMKSRYIY